MYTLCSLYDHWATLKTSPASKACETFTTHKDYDYSHSTKFVMLCIIGNHTCTRQHRIITLATTTATWVHITLPTLTRHSSHWGWITLPTPSCMVRKTRFSQEAIELAFCLALKISLWLQVLQFDPCEGTSHAGYYVLNKCILSYCFVML